ncbi:hypothetical protein LRRHOOD_259 [Mycobacterium phage LRRHood]|uniref:Uncharacterized protein n=1 Tax=Mycobacterium phage LRRHood TaxID=663556 RepID=C9DBB0_9CAUD|nr:hypothetical protein LRRHOOD_259 [Mycobacterium phage LRRHood]
MTIRVKIISSSSGEMFEATKLAVDLRRRHSRLQVHQPMVDYQSASDSESASESASERTFIVANARHAADITQRFDFGKWHDHALKTAKILHEFTGDTWFVLTERSVTTIETVFYTVYGPAEGHEL